MTSRRGRRKPETWERSMDGAAAAAPPRAALYQPRRERERESGGHARALPNIWSDGRASEETVASRRRNQSIKSIWRLPTQSPTHRRIALSLRCFPFIISPSFSFCHRSGSTKMPGCRRIGHDACQSQREREREREIIIWGNAEENKRSVCRRHQRILTERRPR